MSMAEKRKYISVGLRPENLLKICEQEWERWMVGLWSEIRKGGERGMKDGHGCPNPFQCCNHTVGFLIGWSQSAETPEGHYKPTYGQT